MSTVETRSDWSIGGSELSQSHVHDFKCQIFTITSLARVYRRSVYAYNAVSAYYFHCLRSIR